MITEEDLQEAIAECEGQKNPNANTCIKLAAFYTIRDNLFPPSDDLDPPMVYSRASKPRDSYSYDSGSEFSKVVLDSDINNVMAVMDELMDTLHIINPRLYDGVMRKLMGE